MPQKIMPIFFACLVLVASTIFNSPAAFGFRSTVGFWRTPAPSAPTSLLLSHTANNKTFSISWTAGYGNGNCKIQYQNSSAVYTDVASPTTISCDAAAASVAITLPSTSPWSASGQSRAVRIMRITDSAILGTFSQNLNCSTLAASATSTPSIDEDCNGNWDNSSSSKSCGTMTASKSCTDGGGGTGSSAQANVSACASFCATSAASDGNPGDACCAYTSGTCYYYYLGTLTSGPSTATACPVGASSYR